MILTSHFPLFSSIVTKLDEKLTSMGNNKFKFKSIEAVIDLSEQKSSDIKNYWCTIYYRPKNTPTYTSETITEIFDTKDEQLSFIDYYADKFIIQKLIVGVEFI